MHSILKEAIPFAKPSLKSQKAKPTTTVVSFAFKATVIAESSSHSGNKIRPSEVENPRKPPTKSSRLQRAERATRSWRQASQEGAGSTRFATTTSSPAAAAAKLPALFPSINHDSEGGEEILHHHAYLCSGEGNVSVGFKKGFSCMIPENHGFRVGEETRGSRKSEMRF